MNRPVEYYVQLMQNEKNRELQAVMFELQEENDPNFLSRIWSNIARGNRWGKILYLKLMKDRTEANILMQLRHFLEEEDKLLNVMAMDILVSRTIVGREELCIDLLSHPENEIRLAAIRLLGNTTYQDSVNFLVRLSTSFSQDSVVRQEARRALIKFPRYKKYFSKQKKEKAEVIKK